MKYINKLTSSIITIFIFSLITVGCSNESNNYKKENEILKVENQQLKDKVIQLDKNVSDYKSKELKQNQLLIAYDAEIPDKVRFIEKENKLLALPQEDSITFNIIQKNTLAKVLDRALVNEEMWIYIEIPVYDTAANYKGWIKEKDTVAYTKEKVKLVQSDVTIKAGSEVYETYKFEDIKTVAPKKMTIDDRGRLEERKDGYCRIFQAGGRDIWVKESSVIYPELR
jgi:PBP1b-binding outer membrane lipoprotein LpoB